MNEQLIKQDKPISNYEMIKNQITATEIIKRFAQVTGSEREAMAYISSVLIVVANDDRLKACRWESIVTSALRAASLHLSCDVGIGQAWLVPYSNECTLQIGYKGLYDLAIRTWKYRHLNVYEVFEGEDPVEDPHTGLYKLSGNRVKGGQPIGWLFCMELVPEKGQVNGYAHDFYMSIEDIHAHAKKFSKAYDKPDAPWKKHTKLMERKTVLSIGLRLYGYLDAADTAVLAEVEGDKIAPAGPITEDLVTVVTTEAESASPEPVVVTVTPIGDEPAPAPVVMVSPDISVTIANVEELERIGKQLDAEDKLQVGMFEPEQTTGMDEKIAAEVAAWEQTKKQAGADEEKYYRFNEYALLHKIALAKNWNDSQALGVMIDAHRAKKVPETVTYNQAMGAIDGVTLDKPRKGSK